MQLKTKSKNASKEALWVKGEKSTEPAKQNYIGTGKCLQGEH